MIKSNAGKILVIDDEVELKNILVEALTAQGYETTGFTSGEEALVALREKAFDVLITDLMMPVMDGIALVRDALEIDPSLIALVMTGQGTIQTAVDSLKVGAYDYLLKPFHLQAILPVLTRAINTRHLRLENVQLREAVAIHELSETIAFTLDPQKVLSKLADAALQQSQADEVSVLLLAPGTEEFYIAAVRGEKRERLLGEHIPFGDSIAGWVARERTPLLLNGEVNDERFVARWPRPEISSSVSIPMQVGKKLVGVLNLNMVNRVRPFTLGQMKALTVLASTAAAALKSASLHAQLQKAEANYRSIFENAVEGIFQSTAAGRFISMNPAMADILGYASPEEAVEGITDIKRQIYVDPRSRSESERIQKEQGLLQGFEFEAYRKDGEKIWLSLNRRSIRDQDDIEMYREGSVENITTRKRAEEAFRETVRSKAESLAVLDTILSTAPIGFAFHNRDLVYERINESLAAINGLPVQAHIGRTLREVLPEMAAALEPHLKRALETGVPTIGLELSGKTPADPGNEHYWLVSFYPVQMKGGEILGVGVLVSEITERKRAEEALRESETRYKGLIDSAFDGVVIHRGGVIVSANRAFAEMFGYGPDEVIGMKILDFTAPECRDFVGGQITQDQSTYETVGLRKEGSRIAMEISGQICLYQGQTARQAAMRDITERKRVEEIQARRAAHALFRADVSAALAASLTPLQATLELCTAAMVQHLGAAFARIWTLNSEGDVLELQASAGMYTHIDGAHGRVPVGSFKIGKIAQERVPHITNDMQTDPRVSDKEWARQEGMVAFAGYPLLLEDRLLGVMALFSRQELPEDTLDALASVAALMSQGIDLKHAQRALKDSDSRKDAILKTALDCVVTIDHEGIVIDFNPAAEHTFGYASEDVVGKKMAELIVPISQRRDHERGFARYLETGCSSMLGKRTEVTAMRADGSEIPVELTITAIGELPHPTFTAFIRDLTERKRSEQHQHRLNAEIESQRKRSNSLLASVPGVVWEAWGQPDGATQQMNFVSDYVETMLGYTVDEWLSTPSFWLTIVHPDDREKASRDAVISFANGKRSTIEFRWMAKDGHAVWVESNYAIISDDEGRPAGMRGVNIDITERKRAEEALRQSKERYRDLVENAHDIIYSHDLEGNYISINLAGEQITGYTREETLKLNLADTVAPDYLPKAREMIRAKVAGKNVTAYELGLIAKDGSAVIVEVNSKLMYEDGAPVAVQGIARDITARKQMERALRESEEQFRQSQKMEAIGQLAGGVAHDFNNLLTAINGYSALALQQINDTQPIKSYLEEIKKAGDRAANLTRQLLAFGRKQILQPAAINLNDVVTDMNKMLRRLIGEDIKLTAKLDLALKKIKADPGQIEQVLVNLVVNARDAMPQGGQMTIETANVELDEQYPSRHVGSDPGSYVMLAVIDTGTGMSEETKARIFEPFFTTKEKGKGTGLGLSTVYGIVQQSGGTIWVYSEEQHGTAFKVYLPALTLELQPAEAATFEAATRGGSETILLVEDEDVVRGLASKILEQAGYQVFAATRGQEAISLCAERAETIDLLLTDVVMPETSGKEVADRLTELHPGLKVLFMSGYTDEAIVHHGMLDANVQFIQKPFTPSALKKKVREVLDSELVIA